MLTFVDGSPIWSAAAKTQTNAPYQSGWDNKHTTLNVNKPQTICRFFFLSISIAPVPVLYTVLQRVLAKLQM
jgi:hypothetical protein